IGRGAGNHIKVEDPAWQGGHLRVQHVQGGYLVTNGMPHAVFLDGAVLEEGEQRTWYHGTTLQPTAATILALHADEARRPGRRASAAWRRWRRRRPSRSRAGRWPCWAGRWSSWG